MTLKIRLAVRDWDYMTPLLLGDITSKRLQLEVERIATMPVGIGKGSSHDAGEASFSRHLTDVAEGHNSTVAIPNFLMRGFRHGCIITRKNSPLTKVTELAGKRIGVTGWRDSGNTWTRAILRNEGIMTDDAYWYAGRLTEAHPIQDRLGEFGQPGRIEPMPNETPMMRSLAEGWLDAVFTPFMPEGFFSQNSQFRQLLPNCREAQTSYFHDVGYVPGIHLLALDREIAEVHPWAAQELSDMIDESRRMWISKRRRYADTTPFMLEEMLYTATALSPDWDASGIAANRIMISDFLDQMHEQGILNRPLQTEEVFGLQETVEQSA
ncbi:nitrate ABC transporter substrate-binding protein [Sulfitobacter sp. 1A15106]|uniref:nitrate ABC transporter substrate-binding protein n=1 Tax=Sulfitobacter sp. 1A15106 TaxID=3368590 RepID=UPI003745DFAE